MENTQTLTITETINGFGDSVYSFLGKSYNFYQYNCSAGKELIKKLKTIQAPVLLLQHEEYHDGLHVIIRPALKILEDMLETDKQLSNISFGNNDSAGAEFAGLFGY